MPWSPILEEFLQLNGYLKHVCEKKGSRFILLPKASCFGHGSVQRIKVSSSQIGSFNYKELAIKGILPDDWEDRNKETTEEVVSLSNRVCTARLVVILLKSVGVPFLGQNKDPDESITTQKALGYCCALLLGVSEYWVLSRLNQLGLHALEFICSEFLSICLMGLSV